MTHVRITISQEEGGSQSKLGAVWVLPGSTFSAIREEMEQDLSDVLPEGWVFLDFEDAEVVEIRPQQELKWRVTGNSIVIRAVTVPVVEECTPDVVEIPDLYLKSKLAQGAGLAWKHEVNRAKAKLRRERNQDGDNLEDNFEATTEDIDGRVRYSIFCIDCKKSFNSGGKRDLLKNYTSSHLKTAGHKQALRRARAVIEVSEEAQSFEDKNKQLVHETMEQVVKFCEPLRCSFELSPLSPTDFSDLTKIKIRCTLDLTPVQLFPLRGSFMHNIEAHVTSKVHVLATVNSEDSVSERKGKRKLDNHSAGGRPTKLAAIDAKQLGITQFFPS